MQQLEFKLDVFEGPLDLLLHLISKHKLNINDIEISVLLEQYISYIEELEASDLEVASEFLAMAARLVYIKTASLLPKHDEDGDQLKRELEGQLIEYQLAKIIAQKLNTLSMGGLIFTRNPMPIEIDKIYRNTHDKNELYDAYVSAIGKAKRKLPPPKTAFSGIVSRRMVSVESRIIFVLRKLYTNGAVSYNEFFYSDDRSELVATFLAMLELIKSKRIVVSDDNTQITFNKERRFSEDDMQQAINEYEENNNEDDTNGD